MRSEFPTEHRETAPARDVYTVSRLNRETRFLLERQFGSLWIEGELTNLARPRSGHWYFSLKDDAAQVRCAMFRSRNALVGFVPGDGQQVLVRARVGMYEPRGEFQLIAEHLEAAGEGALRLRFEALKRKLAIEGLFDEDRKVELPWWPERIGVVTSPSGAAIRDVLTVLERRNPAIEVVIYPVAVQGAQAAGEIVAALETASRRAECDVLILTRGGGSLEDLWPFNEEVVARAIAATSIPIVAAVGHEIDFTIADLVADVRAPTPSASAELVSPERTEVARLVNSLRQRLGQHIGGELHHRAMHLRHLRARLQHPGRRLEQFHQRIDELLQRLPIGVNTGMRLRAGRLQTATARLRAADPRHRVTEYAQRVRALEKRLALATAAQLRRRQAGLDETVRALRAVSPAATLDRGYAIVTTPTGTIAREAAGFSPGDRLRATLARGSLDLSVTAVTPAAGVANTDSNDDAE